MSNRRAVEYTFAKRHHEIGGQLRHMHGWRRGHAEPSIPSLPATGHITQPVDFREAFPQFMPTLRDQGSLGSCTANAGSELMGFIHRKVFGGDDPFFSVLDLYAAVRTAEGTPLTEDSGAIIADIFKVLHKQGVCLSSTWPYDTGKFDLEPPATAVLEAHKHLALKIYSCPSLSHICQALSMGFAVEFGFQCFESLESSQVAANGHIPLPGPHEQCIGGHAVLAVGFTKPIDDDKGEIILQNSWGNWGDHGFGYLPYGYWHRHLADDAHTFHAETK